MNDTTKKLLEACKQLLDAVHRHYPLDWQGLKGAARLAICDAEYQLKPEQLAHVESGGHVCPFCKAGDDKLDFGSAEFDHGIIQQRGRCMACGRTWFDRYALVGFELEAD